MRTLRMAPQVYPVARDRRDKDLSRDSHVVGHAESDESVSIESAGGDGHHRRKSGKDDRANREGADIEWNQGCEGWDHVPPSTVAVRRRPRTALHSHTSQTH